MDVLIIARHGSDTNEVINANGKAQMARLAAAIQPDLAGKTALILCSNARWAKQSGEELARHLPGVPIEMCEELNEFSETIRVNAGFVSLFLSSVNSRADVVVAITHKGITRVLPEVVCREMECTGWAVVENGEAVRIDFVADTCTKIT